MNLLDMSPQLGQPSLLTCSTTNTRLLESGVFFLSGGSMFRLDRTPAVGGYLELEVEWRSPSGDVIVPSQVRYQLFAYDSQGILFPVSDPYITGTASSTPEIKFNSYDLRAVDGSDLRRVAVVEIYSSTNQSQMDRETVEFTLSPIPTIQESNKPVPPTPVPVKIVDISVPSEIDPRRFTALTVTADAPFQAVDPAVYYDPKHNPTALSPEFIFDPEFEIGSSLASEYADIDAIHRDGKVYGSLFYHSLEVLGSVDSKGFCLPVVLNLSGKELSLVRRNHPEESVYLDPADESTLLLLLVVGSEDYWEITLDGVYLGTLTFENCVSIGA